MSVALICERSQGATPKAGAARDTSRTTWLGLVSRNFRHRFLGRRYPAETPSPPVGGLVISALAGSGCGRSLAGGRWPGLRQRVKMAATH